MNEDSAKQLWRSAMILNCAVRKMDLSSLVELRARAHQEMVKQLGRYLRESCERIVGNLTRLKLYQADLTSVLHWEGKKEAYVWLALDASAAGQIVLQLASALPGHERRTVVKLQPYIAEIGVRDGWEISPHEVLSGSQFADYCVGKLLDYCVDVLSEEASGRVSSHQVPGG
jgi:hypothetical protein